jgi:hypothetical protein
VGAGVGRDDGDLLGSREGKAVGLAVVVGDNVGDADGLNVGVKLGAIDGAGVGLVHWSLERVNQKVVSLFMEHN